ncbi:efflux RND transporter periplasmic adaptor subunit [Syntrophothermus sp.]|uniref:efflux RND transporter periplasmic adaptor subunit n=1 Tax=Syntrophothermus sp. TaxID=2736299 RepID=UPI0025800876|nr:efflux RND transporter periplasmic adaptor subunit [Syntrophothermus sp.]
MRPRHKLPKIPKWLLVAMAGFIGLASWYNLRATPVTVAHLETKTITSEVKASGEIEPAEKLMLTSKTSGKVETVAVEAGSMVKKGQVLASLDTTELKLETAIAEARYQALVAQLAGVQAVEPAKAEAALTKAKAALQSAERQYERAQLLFEAGAISKSDLETYELSLEEARTAVTIAEQEAKKVQSPGGYEIKTLSFQVKEALANLDLARSRLQQAVITAPFDSRVYYRYVDPGSYVNPGTALFMLGRGQEMVVKSYILEEEAPGVKQGQEARMSGPVLGDSVLYGHVVYVAPAAEKVVSSLGVEQTKVMVKILPNDSSRLKPGFKLDLAIITAKKENVSAIPVSAVLEDGTKHQVLVVDKGKVALKTVETGITDGEYVEIVKGLSPADKVILEPDKIKSGQRVKPVPVLK